MIGLTLIRMSDASHQRLVAQFFRCIYRVFLGLVVCISNSKSTCMLKHIICNCGAFWLSLWTWFHIHVSHNSHSLICQQWG